MTMMMSQLGPVGIVLSVVFVVFMTVLFLELCYVWCSRHRRLQEARGDSSVNIVQARKRGHCTWPKTVWACGSGPAAESGEPKQWGKLLWWRSPVEAKMAWSDGVMQEEGKAGKQGEGLATVRGEGEEVEEEEDVLRMGGLWGPPRLLFTIKEETKEEMELEEVHCCAKVSRASSDPQQLLLFSTNSSSGCSSPFVTPPSSPPFATPLGSPGAASARTSAPAWEPPNSTHHAAAFLEVDSSSSSNSNSSSSPLLQSRRHLSILFDDTSSFSPSSVASTPVEAHSPSSAGGPSSSACSSPNNKRAQRHPLCLLLDPPPSQCSSLYHYHIKRVHPLTQAGDGEPKSSPSQLPLTKPEPPLPFHIPMPSQPTTPCPFRPSLHAKGASPLTSLLNPRVMNRV